LRCLKPLSLECLELVTEIAQPLQSIIDIEKTRLPSHRIISDPSVTMESERQRIGEVLRSIQVIAVLSNDPDGFGKGDIRVIALQADLGRVAGAGPHGAVGGAYAWDRAEPIVTMASPVCSGGNRGPCHGERLCDDSDDWRFFSWRRCRHRALNLNSFGVAQ
jgi:hypothetical protein